MKYAQITEKQIDEIINEIDVRMWLYDSLDQLACDKCGLNIHHDDAKILIDAIILCEAKKIQKGV